MDAVALAHFRTHGWVLLPDVLDVAALDAARRSLAAVYPSAEGFAAAPDDHAWVGDGPFGGVRLLPVDDVVLDLLPLHPALVVVARELLGTSDVRLLRAGYQAKYAGAADYDQVLHFDYPNHSLVVPVDDDVIGFFVFVDDVTDDLGPTMLVSDVDRGPLRSDRTHGGPTHRPDLYAVERPAVGAAGTVLAYRATTYHRGSAMTATTGRRLTLAFGYGRATSPTGYTAWPRLGEEPGLVAALVAATPEQRTLLGFPPPGDPYWTHSTVDLVAARYPGMDMAPYRSR